MDTSADTPSRGPSHIRNTHNDKTQTRHTQPHTATHPAIHTHTCINKTPHTHAQPCIHLTHSTTPPPHWVVGKPHPGH
eukprot:NODE_3487_length_549_cov_75.024000_g2949_i0.p3 GENE.NODE_3487_length_549_cov_75.024000_g2949_i0~~NODE_3487_length_549_cov_75.024000_g2949_i0.p3  ORF type:complete len:78 (-),score=27.18 NODE_3487_length_549_cov_75.024000_g2949_i0:154-387(-)